MAKQRVTVGERLTRYAVRDESGCLLWTACVERGGYGLATVNGKLVKAHRMAWEFANGPIPPGMLVCHTCDVRRCVEPTHLWLGTYADNAADMYAKGRHPNIGGWNAGRPHSPETRARIAKAASNRPGHPQTPETRALISASKMGHKPSTETKSKISASLRARRPA